MSRWRLRVGLAVALLAPPAAAQGGGESLQAFLMTMGPGASIYERFGHNAIWIRDTTTGLDLVYNYGTFDFDDPGFVSRFVFGRPRYWLDVASIDLTLRTYAHYQRDVMVQELALPPGKKAELAMRLAENLLPENRTYLYDYYRDNCSTRVRDMLDLILGGALRQATEGTPGEGTLRFHTQRSVSNDPGMYLGILAAMGPATDAPLDQWGEMFLPAKVQARVRELTVPDSAGRAVPLVIREDTLLHVGVHAVEPTRPDWSGRLLVVGLLVGAVSLTGLLRGGAGMSGRVVATLWLVVSGVAGLVLLFLWFGTDHVATRGNWNVALLNPLGLFLVPTLWRRRIAPALDRWEVAVGTAYALSLVTALVAVWAGAQSTGEILALAFFPGLAAHFVALMLSLRLAPARPTPP